MLNGEIDFMSPFFTFGQSFDYFHGYPADSSYFLFVQKLEEPSLTSTSFLSVFDIWTWGYFTLSWLATSAIILAIYIYRQPEEVTSKQV